MQPVSVVVPTRGLGTALRERCARTAACLPGAQIIVCEPDDLGARAQQPPLPEGWQLVRAPRGRGTQCNGGARAAAGELLMFLHDDTDLPRDAAVVLAAAFRDPGIGMACFRLAFDRRHWLLGAYAWGSRFESRLTTFGDQAMTIRRDLFEAVGGFPDWPLFEDVELARRVRQCSHRCSRIAKLPSAVTTSASRFLAHGPARQQLANGLLLARFLLGAPPARLAAIYERQRGALPRGDAA
ncbi:glycosyltransferase family 2 protein [uncultured Thiodictyon sp.]|jgi:hypothetical protein|uniref:TIGR04283 family arsenosugar biosynthesis glycosyltransferase n=1 Tax=uncultured Thiodictyon sp. TaxID=1846217 RepID=UPI0025F0DAD0|nr:glycosyltransferase family 2 protein [uncultured Thiodictyon sp.]